MQYFISFRRDTTSRPPHALPLAHSSCSLCVTCLGGCPASSHGTRHVSREEIQKLIFFLSGICKLLLSKFTKLHVYAIIESTRDLGKGRQYSRDYRYFEEGCWREFWSFGTWHSWNIKYFLFLAFLFWTPQTTNIIFSSWNKYGI